jgi:hypothetical protein
MIFGGCFGSRGFLTQEQWEAAVELLRDHQLAVELDKCAEASVCWIQSSAESKAGVLVVHGAGTGADGEKEKNVLILCKTPFLRLPFVSPKVSEAEKVLQAVLGVFRLHGFVAEPV